MPLNDHIPIIDNRRYDEIITEVRTRIARYTPEWKPVWTDVNDNDPGITLTQVFAWLSEMLIYRMNKVPELHYIKFLQLLGIELNPAKPSKAEITFPVIENHSEPFIIIPARTQLSAEAAEGEPPIVFETDRSLIALTARLKAVQSSDGYSFSDVTRENDDATLGFEPFGPLANPESFIMLGFEFLSEFPQVEINLALFAFNDVSAPGFFNCNLPESQYFPSVEILWEYWNGQEWRKMAFLKDETRAFTQSGHIFLKSPLEGEMKRGQFGDIGESLHWIRGRIEKGSYERTPRLMTIRTNTMTAMQAETVLGEILGGSNGRPNQEFKLENKPVLEETVVLEIDEGDGFKEWTIVPDFFGSSPDDNHFVLNRTTGEITMGDGLNGNIPVANPDNPGANIVARSYRFGGGKRGNVPAAGINSLLTSIDGVDEAKIANITAAHSGRDEERLEEAKLRAPRTLKSKCRAVTEEDFETLAKEAANIKRAKALPLYHPDFPDTRVPGVVTVIVVPDGDADNPMPIPSEGTLRTVCAYLNKRRLLTTELYVVKPNYQQVKIDVEAVAENEADLAEVTGGIQAKLLDYFHPLKGGDDGMGWKFGDDIFFSRVSQQIFTALGVQRIETLLISVDGIQYPKCEDVKIADGVLLYSTQHDVNVNYSFIE